MARILTNECTAKGCGRKLRPENLSGLCKTHYKPTTPPTATCKECSSVLSWGNRSGLCFLHLYGTPKKCVDCGKVISRGNKSGKCAGCKSVAARIPADRLDDYDLMCGRLGKAELAAEWILSGKPVVPPLHSNKCRISAKDAVRQVAAELDVCAKDITGDGRFKHIVRARATVAVALHRAGMPFAQIARRLNRDHTTIIYLVRRFPEYAVIDARLERVARQVAA